jgi:hypothetical protein
MIYEGDELRRLGLLAKDADPDEAKEFITKNLGGYASDIVKITEKDIKESEGWFASRITVVDKIVVAEGSKTVKFIEQAVETANIEWENKESQKEIIEGVVEGFAAPIGEPGYLKKFLNAITPEIKEGEDVRDYLARKLHITDAEQEEAPIMAQPVKRVKKEQKKSEDTPETWGVYEEDENWKGAVYIKSVEGSAGGETAAEAVPEYTLGDVIPEETPEAVGTENVKAQAAEEGEMTEFELSDDQKANKDSKPEGGGKDFTDYL